MLAARGALKLQDVAQASRAGDVGGQRDRPARGRADRPDAGVGRELPQPVACVHRRRRQRIGPLFLAAVRQSVYHRSLALSTRHLEIQYTPLGERAGLIGAGVLAMQESLQARGIAP